MFSSVELAPRDPIFGLTEAYNSDKRPNKTNLGVGVYNDENGKLPLLKAVQQAEEARVQAHPTRGYLPMEGVAAYNKATMELLFGADSAEIKAGRVATFEALGGTGGLRMGADFIKRLKPTATVWISDPSWEKPPRPLRSRRLCRQELPLLRCTQPWHRLRKDAGLPEQPARR